MMVTPPSLVLGILDPLHQNTFYECYSPFSWQNPSKYFFFQIGIVSAFVYGNDIIIIIGRVRDVEFI